MWCNSPRVSRIPAKLGMLIRPREHGGANRPVTVAIWENGTAALSLHSEWIEAECADGRTVFVVNLSGVDPLKPRRSQPWGDVRLPWHLAQTFG